MQLDNFFVWFYSFLQKVISFSDELFNILTTDINLGPISFQIWHAVLGGGFIIFLTLALIKKFVPLA